MAIAYIGLGSNLNEPLQQINTALNHLGATPSIQLQAVSKVYKTPPLGPANQPDYINAAVKLTTELSAHVLLTNLQAIEKAQGRVRSRERWGPRSIDLDLLLYADDCINTTDLTVPHPGITQRSFVLYPLQDLNPDLYIPKLGLINALIKNLNEDRPQVLTNATLELP